MRLLLDTCTFIWWLTQPARVPARTLRALNSQDNSVYLSTASAWELSIKVGLKRLKLPMPAPRFVDDAMEKFSLLPLHATIEHGLAAGTLPYHHKDPFDRLLAAQSSTEQLPLVSPDPAFEPYGLQLMWE